MRQRVRRNHIPRAFLISAIAGATLSAASANTAPTVDFPGKQPGIARALIDQGRAALENDILSFQWSIADGRLRPIHFEDKIAGTKTDFSGTECFTLNISKSPSSAGVPVAASAMRRPFPAKLVTFPADRDSAARPGRPPGKAIVIKLLSEDGRLEVSWKASLRDGDSTIRQEVLLSSERGATEVTDLTLLDVAVPSAEVVGAVDGSPVRAGTWFAAIEHPMSKSEVLPGDGGKVRVRCTYPYNISILPGAPVTFRSVMGIAPAGQLRRAFLYYLERERARPYHTFLHYNCGYELGCRFWQLRRQGTPEEFESFLGGQEQAWIDRIEIFGRELVAKRGVTIDSFVHDHGWDDTERVWQFHKGFPAGLENVRRAARKYNSEIGIWFSPWGGYSGRARRVEAGQRQGFETSKLGLSLAGPRYFNRFREACLGMTRDFGVNYFKFDGFAAGNSLSGAGAYSGEVEALLRICDDLRGLKPDVFLNPTTGTWPSPFWMLWADAIWRQESDAGFLGKGSDRQQWITYRDNATYQATVKKGPLCPISSLMLHGIMIHKMAFKNPYDPKSPAVSREPKDVLDEIRSYFATGTCMQELHIDASLMSDNPWDVLAECAKWSRSNADVLADVHWVGGDPSKGEIYGWAAWSRRKGILSLRNPSDQPATMTLDIAQAFELPEGAPRSYVLKSPWKDAAEAPIRVEAARGHQFKLKPFEVVVYDAALDTQAAQDSPSGLVAHWTFDEGAGDIARDISGHGHDATLKNTEWVRSPRGHALRFDSREDLARYAGIDSMNMSGDMSLAVWVRTDATVAPDTNRLIFGDGGGGIDRNLNLRLDGSGGLRFEWGNGRESSSLIGPGRLMNGTWRHVAIVADSRAETVTMYVDGDMVAQADHAMPVSRAPVRERLTGWFYNGFFQGELDDIRLYSRALPEQEVRKLFVSEADVQAGEAVVALDSSGEKPRGILTMAFHNKREKHRFLLKDRGSLKKDLALPPGESIQLPLGEVGLERVWKNRNDLFICRQTQAVSVAISGGHFVDELKLGLPRQLLLEPVRLRVKNPWCREMAQAMGTRIEGVVELSIVAEQLRAGLLRLALVARESGKEVLVRELKSPATRQTVDLDVAALPWGAYELVASFHDAAGKEWARTSRAVPILPQNGHRPRVLNNFVTELLNMAGRGPADGRVEFMNPREGWVWFRASGPCAVRLSGEQILSIGVGGGTAEAMRLLPAGRHAIEVTGAPGELMVRAIPALVYNVYPSTPMIQPFGANTWERLGKHMLPNCNMIEGQVFGTDEHREWTSQGKKWLASVQAPGLMDEKNWPEEKLLDLWLNPGRSTAHAERPGIEIAKVSGVQVDEYYPGAKSVRAELAEATALSLARLSEDAAYAGKFWIPFFAGKYGASDPLFMRVLLGSGWPFAEEVYIGEMPTETENRQSMRSRLIDVARAYEKADPDCIRRMIFTPMYAYLPYCTANRCPGADFRVHLEMQLQMLASEPPFFGLWGVQPYRSNYVDEETLHCMGRLLRHYCIEGKTESLFGAPYELAHLKNPDFESGLASWDIAAAEDGAIHAGKFAGYGQAQGRYPATTFGDTFACMRRDAKRPNVLKQQLAELEPGKLYSVKLISGDYGDLKAGRTRKERLALSIRVEGAGPPTQEFNHSFPGARGPKPFTREKPFWMTYHWLRFRATATTANLRISDWAKEGEPGGTIGQETMVNFVEVQPVLDDI